jgi:hypothetical protein
VNYIDSIFDGGCPIAAERWHEMVETLQRGTNAGREAEDLHIITTEDLERLVNRENPYQGFSRDEIVRLLDHLKEEWVRNGDFRFVTVAESVLPPDTKLELAGNISLTTFGREMRLEHRQDLRIYWDHNSRAVDFTRDGLMRLKRCAGLGTRERPSAQDVERTIDNLLLRVDASRS